LTIVFVLFFGEGIFSLFFFEEGEVFFFFLQLILSPYSPTCPISHFFSFFWRNVVAGPMFSFFFPFRDFSRENAFFFFFFSSFGSSFI